MDAIAAWWQRQDYARTPRFDLAAFPCGPQADIVLVRLPQSAGELQRDGRQVLEDRGVRRQRCSRTPSSKYLVYYDGPVDDVNLCGEGGGSADGAGRRNRLPGSLPGRGASAVVAVHELIHAFGALPDSGPPHPCPGLDSGTSVRLVG